MIYRILVVFFFVLLSSCDSTKYLTIDNKEYKALVGPGLITVIDNNLYADQTEVTNSMYLEFIIWTEGIFGKNSDDYRQIQLDTSVWDNTEFSEELGEAYFTHSDFYEHPVVGISLEQAELFTKWRTSRVAQLILIQKGLIKSEYTFSKNNYFTIDRYLNGDYDWIITKENLLVPEYKIPTKSEWELIVEANSNYSNGVDLNLRPNKRILNKPLYNTKEFHLDSLSLTKRNKIGCVTTCQVKTFKANIYGLYDVIGNVSELTSTIGVSKGGSWKNRLTNDQIGKDFLFETPNAWTGFRNIARQRFLKVNKGR